MARYDGFISYSHAADGALAPAIQLGLQRLAKPWNKRRALSVFRDETGLSTNPHLWSGIELALDDADWFVLLASPDAAASEWVDKELTHWLDHNDQGRILPVVTDGTWEWADGRLSGTAVPARLTAAFKDEPRHLDLRWARSEIDLDLRHSRFRGAIADLAAPMHGVPKDELEGEDIRQHRRVRRLTRSALVALAVLLTASVAAASVAVGQRERADREAATAREQAVEARRQADIARAERLAALALGMADSRSDLALLLAVEGFDLYDDVLTRQALLTVLTTNRGVTQLRTLRPPQGILAGAFSPDGETSFSAVASGTMYFRDARAEQDLIEPVQRLPPIPNTAIYSPDSSRVATRTPEGQIEVWDPRSGQRLGPTMFGGGVSPYALLGTLAIRSDNAVIAAADTDGNVVQFFSMVDGQPVAGPVQIEKPVDLKYRADGAALIAGGSGQVVVVDATSMQKTHDLPAAGSSITAVALSSDGRWAYGGDEAGQLHIWDLDTGGAVRSVDAHSQAIHDIAIEPDTELITTAGADRQVRRWDSASATETSTPLTGFSEVPLGLLYTKDGTLYTLAAGEVTQWDLGASSLAEAVPGSGMTSSGPAGGVLLIDETRRLLTRYDTNTGGSSGEALIAAPEAIRKAGLDAGSGRYAYIVTGEPGALSVTIASVETGELTLTRDLPDGMTVEDLSPDGHTLLLRPESEPNTYACCDIVWDAETERIVMESELDVGAAIGSTAQGSFTGAFSRDGDHVLLWAPFGVSHSYVSRLSLDEADVPVRYEAPAIPSAGAPSSLVVGPDGLVAISADFHIQLLEEANLTPLGAELVGGAAIARMAFSTDGSLLAAAGGRTVELWDVETHQRVGTFDVGAEVVNLALIAGEHPALLTSMSDQVLRWDLNPDHWSSLACELAGRTLTPEERELYLSDPASDPVCRS